MKRLLASLGVAAATLLPVVPVSAITMSITPPTQAIGIGGTASVDITVSGLDAAAEAVAGFDIDLLFDPAILDASSVSLNLAEFGGADNLDAGFSFLPSAVDIQLVSFLTDADLDALQGDSVLLGRVNFLGLADGFSSLSFGVDPDFGRNVVGRDALSLELTAGTACIAVGTGTCGQVPVPEPSTLALVAAALLGFGVVFRSGWANMTD